MTQQLTRPARTARKMSYAEFLKWDGENQHVEWVNGEVIPLAPIGDVHQDVGRWLISLLNFFVDAHALGVIRYEPFQMKTGPDLPGRAPDILFVAKQNKSRLKKNHLEGPGDLVVEIVSPGSGVRDRKTKFAEYEQGGVREYWLIDPKRKQADFYQLRADGKFHSIRVETGIFRSVVLNGVWLEVAWLWQKSLPPTPDVWKMWNQGK
jgi:Uma2 family endonuclease